MSTVIENLKRKKQLDNDYLEPLTIPKEKVKKQNIKVPP